MKKIEGSFTKGARLQAIPGIISAVFIIGLFTWIFITYAEERLMSGALILIGIVMLLVMLRSMQYNKGAKLELQYNKGELRFNAQYGFKKKLEFTEKELDYVSGSMTALGIRLKDGSKYSISGLSNAAKITAALRKALGVPTVLESIDELKKEADFYKKKARPFIALSWIALIGLAAAVIFVIIWALDARGGIESYTVLYAAVAAMALCAALLWLGLGKVTKENERKAQIEYRLRKRLFDGTEEVKNLKRVFYDYEMFVRICVCLNGKRAHYVIDGITDRLTMEKRIVSAEFPSEAKLMEALSKILDMELLIEA